MRIHNISFPHPVLGIGDDIITVNPTAINVIRAENGASYVFSISLMGTTTEISDLVKNGKAWYACEVNCVTTLYRKAWKGDQPDFDIIIPKDELGKTVSFAGMVVAKEEINPYKSNDFNPDYAGAAFHILPGDLLAWYGEVEYQADINYEKISSIASIMKITEDPEARTPHFLYGEDKINIQLPTELYNQFRDSINGSVYEDLVHASLAQQALVGALMNYEANSQTLWARTLDYRLKNENRLKGYAEAVETTDINGIMELAQIILFDPYKRMFASLKQLSPEEEE